MTLPCWMNAPFIRRVEGRTYVCPWRTRLRMLTSLLAFRAVVPDEVADAFVPEMEAQRAAGNSPPWMRKRQRSVLTSSKRIGMCHCAGSALLTTPRRILVEDKAGLRLRYETTTRDARTRLRHTLDILEESDIDEGVTTAVRELLDWLSVFSDDGLVELDYGTVARMFDDEELPRPLGGRAMAVPCSLGGGRLAARGMDLRHAFGALERGQIGRDPD